MPTLFDNLPLGPGVHFLSVRHDDWCPTIRTQKMGDCICNPTQALVSEAQWTEQVVAGNRRERRLREREQRKGRK